MTMAKRLTIRQLQRALDLQREEARQQAEFWLDATSDLEVTLDRYIQLFAEAPIGYVTLDDRGAILEMNPRAATLTNSNAAKSKGKPFVSFVFRPDVKLFLRHLLRGAHAEVDSELRLGRGPHGPRWVRLISRRVQPPQARHPNYFIIIDDIGEAHETALTLRLSEKRHREIVEAANEGICIANEASEIVFVNPRLGAMLGVPAESLIGRPILELTPDDPHTLASGALDRPRGPRTPEEQRMRRFDGSTLHASVSESIMRDDHGRFTGTLRIYSDATARHDLIETREKVVRQLVAAQEGERDRIARELHDQLGQHVVGLSLGLARLATIAAQDDVATHIIQQLKTIANSLGRDIHTLALELRPSALDHLGLEAALRGYVEDLATRSHLQIDVHCDQLDDLRLDSAVQTGIYRIAQEALTNIVKHAKATTVSVLLEKRAQALQLIVEDNGHGFEINGRGTHKVTKLGLAGMRERAALLGGVLTIESSPGHGTTVYVRIPIDVLRQKDNEQETSAVTG